MKKLTALEKAGHPVVRIVMKSVDHIGQEFFRFEMATAVAGAVLGINPFNQPDVEDAKIKTRELTAAFEKTGNCLRKARDGHARGRSLHRRTQCRRIAQGRRRWRSRLLAEEPISRARARATMCAACLYRAQSRAYRRLQDMRLAVRDKRHVATCAEFGPRFLHSTGQAYKGGPTAACFCRSPPMTPGSRGARPEGQLSA
jgi:transaldolase/glucose-6-phosphate isomerase